MAKPVVQIKDASLRDLTWTLANARAVDKEEILASGPRSLVEAGWITSHLTERVGGIAKAVWIDGNPEAAFGFTCQSELTPWLFSAWAWGSEKLPLCMPTMAAWAHDCFFGEVERLGMVRIEARSMVEHREAHRWLLWMHFEKEADLVDWGRDRKRFVLFAWTRTRYAERLRAGKVKGIAADAAGGQRHVLRWEQPASAAAAAADPQH